MLKKRYIIICAVIVACVIAFVIYCIFGKYSSYDVSSELRSENAGKTSYVKAFKGLMAYNPDGASLSTISGERKWNISFEMQDPRIEKTPDYILLYDRQGSIIEILTAAGESAKINASYPITTACISKNGYVSVIMQQESIAYITTYDSSGTIVANGQMHALEGGYPISIALSSDGSVLCLSAINISEGKTGTDLIFYDFSDSEKTNKNNIIKKFSYPDEIIPVIKYIENDRLLAMGTTGVKVFTGSKEPNLGHEVLVDTEIKSVAYNDKYFGIIREAENEEGEIENRLEVYSHSGNKRFSKKIEDSYSKFELLENNEILITNGKKTSLYSIFGVEKFSYEFDNDISDIMPAQGLWDYYLLQGGQLMRIKLTRN